MAKVFWWVGAVVAIALIVGAPTSSYGSCSDPGGCVTGGAVSWNRWIEWPTSANAFVWAYWAILLILVVVLFLTALRWARRRGRQRQNPVVETAWPKD